MSFREWSLLKKCLLTGVYLHDCVFPNVERSHIPLWMGLAVLPAFCFFFFILGV